MMSTELAMRHNRESLYARDVDSKLQHLEKAIDELARAVKIVELNQRSLHEKLENIALLMGSRPGSG